MLSGLLIKQKLYSALSLFPHVYQWVPGIITLVGNLAMDYCIPSGREKHYSESLYATKTEAKYWPGRPPGLYADLTYLMSNLYCYTGSNAMEVTFWHYERSIF